MFYSDWSTATGNSDAALRDTDKAIPWDETYHPTDMEVVDASSEGLTNWPTTNALAMTNPSGRTAWVRIVGIADGGSTDVIPILAMGESLYYRWCFQHSIPDNSPRDEEHTVEQNMGRWNSDNGDWVFQPTYRGVDGKYTINYASYGARPWPDDAYGPESYFGSPLSKNHTYRFEPRQHRTGANAYQLHARIYDGDGTLLYDDDDFYNKQDTNTLADGQTWTYMAINQTHELQVGLNGFASGGFTWGYYGAICIRTDDWCGCYSGGT